MSIVKLKNGSEFFLPTEDADRLAEARNNGAKMIDLRRFELGIRWVDPTLIAEIKDGGVDPRIKQLAKPAPAPVSEEKMAEQRTKMAQIRAKYFGTGRKA